MAKCINQNSINTSFLPIYFKHIKKYRMAGLLYKQIFLGFLVTLTLTSAINPTWAARVLVGARNAEFIRISCQATTYPNLCYTSLSSHASDIRADPQLLAHTALTLTLQTAESTSAVMVKMGKSQGLSHREVGAMRDCVEELRDSVNEIRKSLGEMKQLKGSDFNLKVNDIQTWVSAALTDEDTCTEGFAKGNVKAAVREAIVNVAHMTSNALALINAFAALHN
nr:21 kDa protein-like [Ipomoea batatas]